MNTRLKELREELGVSQSALAKRLKISQSALGYYERGERTMDSEVLSRLADEFTTSIDYILGRSEDRYLPQALDLDFWQETLILILGNELKKFFIKYEKYKKTENALNLEQVFNYSIRGDFRKMLEKHEVLIERLSRIQELKTMQEIDNIVDEYLSNLGEVHSGWKNPDGSWSNDISDWEIELWLRDEFEKLIPGYKEYRGMKIDEWKKRENSKDE